MAISIAITIVWLIVFVTAAAIDFAVKRFNRRVDAIQFQRDVQMRREREEAKRRHPAGGAR